MSQPKCPLLGVGTRHLLLLHLETFQPALGPPCQLWAEPSPWGSGARTVCRGGVGMRTKCMVSCGDWQADGSSQQFCPKAEGDGCLDICRLPAWPLSSVGAVSGQCFSEHDSGHGSVVGLQEGQCPPEDLPPGGEGLSSRGSPRTAGGNLPAQPNGNGLHDTALSS